MPVAAGNRNMESKENMITLSQKPSDWRRSVYQHGTGRKSTGPLSSPLLHLTGRPACYLLFLFFNPASLSKYYGQHKCAERVDDSTVSQQKLPFLKFLTEENRKSGILISSLVKNSENLSLRHGHAIWPSWFWFHRGRLPSLCSVTTNEILGFTYRLGKCMLSFTKRTGEQQQ